MSARLFLASSVVYVITGSTKLVVFL